MKYFIILLLAVAITGCASSKGFDRGSLRAQIEDQQIAATADDITAVAPKPLPTPFKLAIYFVQPKSDRRHESSWTWKEEEKDLLLQIGDDLKGKRILSNIFVLDDSALEGDGNEAVREAASRAGADAVLIVNGISSIDRYNNKYGITYLFLVTPFFVSGTEADCLVLINASMWDVQSKYVHMLADAEGSARQTRPAFLISETRIINDAKSSALTLLKNELTTRLIGMNVK